MATYARKVMRAADLKGWWAFPVLVLIARLLGWLNPAESDWWLLVSTQLERGVADALALEWAAQEPAHIWLKDGWVNALYVRAGNGRYLGLRAFQYLAGLILTVRRGLSVLSKRFSRFWRHIGVWAVVAHLRVGPAHTHRAWEGIVDVRKETVLPLLYHELKRRSVPHLARLMRQLAACDSFEFTAQGPDFQIKGEGHWGHPADAAGEPLDVGYLAGEEKRELGWLWGAWDAQWLITLVPRRHKLLSECYDIQLLSNEMRWIGPDNFIRWLRAAMEELLARIRAGDMVRVLGAFGGFDHEDLARYDARRRAGLSPAYPPVRLALGAKAGENPLLWLGAFARQLAAEALRKWSLYHLPMRNGDGFKVYPDWNVPKGKARFQRHTRAGRLTDEYRSVVRLHPDTVADLYAHCDAGDGDDVYLFLGFQTRRGVKGIKAIRRPQMVGQELRLSFEDWVPPQWDLPVVPSLRAVFRKVAIDYPPLEKIRPDVSFDADGHEVAWEDALTVERALWEVKRAEGLQGLVGRYANLLMTLSASLGSLPRRMPITMSDLVDLVQMGKFVLATTDPIVRYIEAWWEALVTRQIPIARFHERCVPERRRGLVRWDDDPANPFNALAKGVAETIAWYEQAMDALAYECRPPILPLADDVYGQKLIRVYRDAWRAIHLEDPDVTPPFWSDEDANHEILDQRAEARRARVHAAVMDFLNSLPLPTRYSAILAAVALVYAEGPLQEGDQTPRWRDAMFTMAGPRVPDAGGGRQVGLSDLLVEALIHYGCLSDLLVEALIHYGYLHDVGVVVDRTEHGRVRQSHVGQTLLKTAPESAHLGVRVRGFGAMMRDLGQEALALPWVAHEQARLAEAPADASPARMFPGSVVTFGTVPWRGVERLALYNEEPLPGGGVRTRRFGLVIPEHEARLEPGRRYVLRWLTFDGSSLFLTVE